MSDSGSQPFDLTGDDVALAKARHVSRRRAIRKDIFGDDGLFGDPAWDMLIDLFIHECEDKPVSTSSICIASGLPMSTALRWLDRLCADGIVTRAADPRDGRRNFIRLSPAVREQLADYLAHHD